MMLGKYFNLPNRQGMWGFSFFEMTLTTKGIK